MFLLGGSTSTCRPVWEHASSSIINIPSDMTCLHLHLQLQATSGESGAGMQDTVLPCRPADAAALGADCNQIALRGSGNHLCAMSSVDVKVPCMLSGAVQP